VNPKPLPHRAFVLIFNVEEGAVDEVLVGVVLCLTDEESEGTKLHAPPPT
jgi:hypothetical protein